MQSTGQTDTHAVSMTSTQGSAMTYVMVWDLLMWMANRGSRPPARRARAYQSARPARSRPDTPQSGRAPVRHVRAPVRGSAGDHVTHTRDAPPLTPRVAPRRVRPPLQKAASPTAVLDAARNPSPSPGARPRVTAPSTEPAAARPARVGATTSSGAR